MALEALRAHRDLAAALAACTVAGDDPPDGAS
jgi:hypothetical protein